MLLNETQQTIRDTVRAFAQERIRPQARAFEAEHGADDDGHYPQ